MILFESTQVRRVVGRLERGERIHDAIQTLARERNVSTGWVTALGAFEWVELCEYDQDEQAYRPARRFDAPCEILSLVGNLSFKDGAPFAHLHVTVSRETDNGVSVVGGHLVDAVVFACELRVECYDDLALGRETDAATGLSLWQGDSIPITPAPPQPQSQPQSQSQSQPQSQPQPQPQSQSQSQSQPPPQLQPQPQPPPPEVSTPPAPAPAPRGTARARRTSMETVAPPGGAAPAPRTTMRTPEVNVDEF